MGVLRYGKSIAEKNELNANLDPNLTYLVQNNCAEMKQKAYAASIVPSHVQQNVAHKLSKRVGLFAVRQDAALRARSLRRADAVLVRTAGRDGGRENAKAANSSQIEVRDHARKHLAVISIIRRALCGRSQAHRVTPGARALASPLFVLWSVHGVPQPLK